MTWPPLSSDRNQLKIVWDEMDCRVTAKGPRSAARLRELQNYRKTISGSDHMKLTMRMPRVSIAVTKAKGGYFEESKI